MEDGIKLTDEYYLSSDGKRNLILHERYEKRDGRGRDAPLSGEHGFRDDGYFRRLDSIANYLVDKEVYKYEGSELEGIIERIEKLRDEIKSNLSEKINVGWHNDKEDIEGK